VIAHLAGGAHDDAVVGSSVEEVLPSAAGASTALLLARTWVWLRFRGSRGPRA